mmetsp:Transcript_7615/g.11720  ORF Transcript_7615/g.11720 Transcript_7615/m.11720 type:complete len:363 (-) Transcript_7615:25-1113(-)
MTISTSAPTLLRRLIIAAACVLQLRSSHAAAAASSQSSTSSYQPTSGVEGKWVAEEEFYGASDITNSDPDGDHSWWEEDEDSEVEESMHQSEYGSTNIQQNVPSEKKRRRWRRKRSDKQQTKEDLSPSSSKQPDRDTQNNEQTSSEYDEEHPMRTDEWALDIHLSRLFSQEGDELFPECYTDRYGRSNTKQPVKKNRYRKRQVMTFATNGYVKVSVNDDYDDNNNDRVDTTSSSVIQTLRNKPRVGKWRVGHSGVAFDIPVQMSASRKSRGNDGKVKEPKMTVLHYHADIHLNKFGERPRMFRGVITRDRHSSFLPPNLFRPVIGTFSAEGIGHDTADTSYKTRAISLSRQQVINDAKSNGK